QEQGHNGQKHENKCRDEEAASPRPPWGGCQRGAGPSFSVCLLGGHRCCSREGVACQDYRRPCGEVQPGNEIDVPCLLVATAAVNLANSFLEARCQAQGSLLARQNAPLFSFRSQ